MTGLLVAGWDSTFPAGVEVPDVFGFDHEDWAARPP
jgi:hypothetical protein